MSIEPDHGDWRPEVFWLVVMALIIILLAAVVGFVITAEGIWASLGFSRRRIVCGVVIANW